MKLPSGTPLIRHEPVKKGLLPSLLSRLPRPFNGYLAVTGLGYNGVEEGIYLVDNDMVTHAYYVHLRFLHEEWGDSALPLTFKTFFSRGVNLDAVEFTPPKLKLTATFNEQAQLTRPFPLLKLPSLLPEGYTKDHVVSIMKLLPIDELNHLRKLIEVGLSFGKKEELG